MSKERRLGRGLEALLGRPVAEPAEQPPEEVTLGLVTGDDQQSTMSRNDDGQLCLDVDAITPNPYQPRQTFDEAEIADLCDSIRTHGILQPIVVRRDGDGYQIIAGERRLRAAQLANWQRVPVQVRDVDDRQMAELAIVENVQRKDLNALEKAASFQRYLQEYGCTQEELAKRVNVDRSTVANLIRLLELPEAVKVLLASGDITQGHARALLPLGDEQEQCTHARKILRDSLSVRATEQMVADHIHQADAGPLSILGGGGASRTANKAAPKGHLAQLEGQLRLSLGTKVDLKQTAKGRGRITIHFKDNDEFERLRAILSADNVSFREAG